MDFKYFLYFNKYTKKSKFNVFIQVVNRLSRFFEHGKYYFTLIGLNLMSIEHVKFPQELTQVIFSYNSIVI